MASYAWAEPAMHLVVACLVWVVFAFLVWVVFATLVWVGFSTLSCDGISARFAVVSLGVGVFDRLFLFLPFPLGVVLDGTFWTPPRTFLPPDVVEFGFVYK